MTIGLGVRFVLGALMLLPVSASAGSRLVFPRVAVQPDRLSSLAISNPTSGDAQVTITAFNSDGTLYESPSGPNPRAATVGAGGRYTVNAGDLFSAPAAAGSSRGSGPLWIEVTSPVEGLAGYYLEGDTRVSLLDGSTLTGSGSDLVLPLVEHGGSSVTELSIINPEPATSATIALDFVDERGSVVHSHLTALEGRAALQGVLTDLFPGNYESARVLRVRSDRPVVCYGFVTRPEESSLVVVPSGNAGAPARTLYFPQFNHGDSWATVLGLVNVKSSTTLVTISMFRSDGTLFPAPLVRENPVARAIPPGGSLRSNLGSLFGLSSAVLSSGWIKVEADNPAITGYIEYGTGPSRAFALAQLDTVTRAVFTYHSAASPFFTGLAILNPGTLAANIELVALSSSGQTLGKTKRSLRSGIRETRLIEEWVPGVRGDAGGSVYLKSDQPVVTTEIVGSETISSLAAVAAQPYVSAFDPASAAPSLKVVPPLAVVETNKSFKFTASGAAVGEWKVGNVPGGGSVTGTVSSTGVFTAPARTPVQHNQAVEAVSAGGDQSSASTVDVIQREVLTSSLTLLTAVAYLKNAERFFIAEQQLVASAPAGGRAQAADPVVNTRISEISESGVPRQLLQVTNDTVSKMIPYLDRGGTSHLLLAGRDTGTIYRLDLDSRRLVPVARGLNRPSSMALDPVTGALLVAQEGASQITVIGADELEAVEAPGRVMAADRDPRAASVPFPTGLAFDRCTGALYVTSQEGVLWEFLQNRRREVLRGLDHPTQVLVLTRQGMPSCYEGVTVFVAERTRVLQINPRRGEAITFLDETNSVRDLGFFSNENRFVAGGEASIIIAEGPQDPGQSRVLFVRVGGLYGEDPIDATISGGLEIARADGWAAYQDRINDTFATSRSTDANLEVPDLTSITVHTLGNSSVVTLTFTAPVAPASLNAPNSITGWIDFDAIPGVGVRSHADDYRPLRPETAGTDFSLDLATGLLVRSTPPGSPGGNDPGVYLAMNFLNNTVSIVIPRTLFNALTSRITATVGNLAEITEIAPEYDYAFVNAQAAVTPSVSFASDAALALESAGSVSIDVVLSTPSTETVTVNYGVTGGTATAADYSLPGGTLAFSPGETRQSIRMSLAADPSDEPDETIVVSLSSPVNATLGTPSAEVFTVADDDPPPTIQFDVAALSASESANTVSLVVSLSAPSGRTVTVNYGVTGGTASGSDYSVTPGTLTFAPGETSKTVSLGIVEDNVREPDESVIVSLSGPVNGVLGAQSSATCTIVDDDGGIPAVQFSSATSAGPEGTTAVELTVLLSGPTDRTVTVNYSVTGGTASSGDFLLTPGALTFVPGETRRTLSLAITNDAMNEADESVVVSLSGAENAILGPQASITYTIHDDDPLPSIQFSAPSSGAVETVTSVELAVSLSAPSGRNVTVNYAVTGGTAAASDYSLAPGTLTFAPGETTRLISLGIVNDLLNESDESVTVSLSAPEGATLGAQTSFNYSIADDDPVPTLQFSAGLASGLESATSVDLAVTLSAPSGRTVTVSYAVTGGTATAGDFTLPPGTLSFAPGETLRSIRLIVVNDSVSEPDKTLTVALSGAVNATLGPVTSQTYTIADDDAPPTVQFTTASAGGAESVTSAGLEVSLSAPSSQTITVSFGVTGGTAGAGDYALPPGVLTFAPGETLKSVNLVVVNDILSEPAETVTVTLSAPVNALLGTPSSETYTIADDDGTPTVQFSTAAAGGAESVTSAGLGVSLSAPSSQTVTVNYAVTGGTAGAGDYALTPGVLTFAPGETLKSVELGVVNDTLSEPAETVTVTLSAPVNAVLGTPSAETYTISDDDGIPSVQFATANSAGPESVSAAGLTVTLSTASDQAVTVNYSVGGGTATGADYSLPPGVLSFAPGETLKTITLAVVDDSLSESDESVTVVLSSPVNASLGGVTGATYTIVDDDPAPAIQFSVSALSGSESAGSVPLTVTLSAAAGREVTVEYAVSGGTASAGDYSLPPGILTFLPGETVKTVSLGITDDQLNETDETVTVVLSAPANAMLGPLSTASFTIHDNDSAPEVLFITAASGGLESSSAAGVTVSLSGPSGLPVTVNYAVAGGTAGPDDYTLPPGTLVFSPGETVKTINVAVVNDSVDEPDETVVVSLSSPVNSNLGVLLTHTLTIVDDDDPPSVRFAASVSGASETSTSTGIVVTLSNPSSFPVSVGYSVTGGSAGSSDYQLLPGSLTFAPGETTKSIALSVLNDVIDEPDETVMVSLSGPVNASLGSGTVLVFTIEDDDPPPTVQFTAVSSSGTEASGTVEFAVSLSAPSGFPITVDYGTAGGTARPGVDFVLLAPNGAVSILPEDGSDPAVSAFKVDGVLGIRASNPRRMYQGAGASGTLTFAPGETLKHIRISVVDDSLAEATETVYFALSHPVNATLGVTTQHLHTIVDNDGTPAPGTGPLGIPQARVVTEAVVDRNRH